MAGFKIGDRVTHRAKHTDRMRGTVVRMGDTPGFVFVRRDKDGNMGCYMVGELKPESTWGIKA